MPSPMTAAQVLAREYLEIRCRILDLAAALDRLERAGGSAADEARLRKIQEGLKILTGNEPDRAERLQLLFSRPYEEGWPHAFGLLKR